MNDYRIVRVGQERIEALPPIELAAASLFNADDLPEGLCDQTVATETFLVAIAQDCLWLSLSPENEPVGFALATLDVPTAHPEEMDVHPAYARQGIGRALVQTLCNWAQVCGFKALTPTILRHLAWNAAFYARLGLLSLDEEERSLMLRERLRSEAELGLANRIAIQFYLT